ncbi:MAG: hypothetical protein II803_00180, partial [Firmicutes bacterium]|nr:hypothetical protein [Bacillota bacterium]
MIKKYEALIASDVLQKAKKLIADDKDHTIEQHKALTLVPAFSRHEELRSDFYQKLVEAEGFKTERDAVNNVYTVIEGTDPNGPTLYVTAHI